MNPEGVIALLPYLFTAGPDRRTLSDPVAVPRTSSCSAGGSRSAGFCCRSMTGLVHGGRAHTDLGHLHPGARRTTEGKTSREIKRCLARYVARDLYRLLKPEPQLLDKA